MVPPLVESWPTVRESLNFLVTTMHETGSCKPHAYWILGLQNGDTNSMPVKVNLHIKQTANYSFNLSLFCPHSICRKSPGLGHQTRWVPISVNEWTEYFKDIRPTDPKADPHLILAHCGESCTTLCITFSCNDKTLTCTSLRRPLGSPSDAMTIIQNIKMEITEHFRQWSCDKLAGGITWYLNILMYPGSLY